MSSDAGSELWDRIPADHRLVENSLLLAERDLNVAQDLLENGQYDWAFSVSYNAMLQAGRGLLFSAGYRPRGEQKHVAVIEFIRQRHHFNAQMLFHFDKMRKKRHIAVYEMTNLISEDEAKHALKVANEFIKEVRQEIK